MFDKQLLIRELETLLVDCGQESSPLSNRVAKFADTWIKRLQEDKGSSIDINALRTMMGDTPGEAPVPKPLDMRGPELSSGTGKIDTRT